MNPIAAAAIRAVFATQCGNRAIRFINPSGRNYNFELEVIYATFFGFGKLYRGRVSCCSTPGGSSNAG
jgi:hypothetical protein